MIRNFANQGLNAMNKGLGSVNDYVSAKKRDAAKKAGPGRKFQPLRRAFQDAATFSEMALAPKREDGFSKGAHQEVINWRNPSTLQHKKGVAEGEFGQPIRQDAVTKFHAEALKFGERVDQSDMDTNKEPGVVSYTQQTDFWNKETAHLETYIVDVDLNRGLASVTEGLEGTRAFATQATPQSDTPISLFVSTENDVIIQEGRIS